MKHQKNLNFTICLSISLEENFRGVPFCSKSNKVLMMKWAKPLTGPQSWNQKQSVFQTKIRLLAFL